RAAAPASRHSAAPPGDGAPRRRDPRARSPRRDRPGRVPRGGRTGAAGAGRIGRPCARAQDSRGACAALPPRVRLRSARIPEKLLHRRWPWLAVAGLVVLAWLATVVRVVGDDTRPAG